MPDLDIRRPTRSHRMVVDTPRYTPETIRKAGGASPRPRPRPTPADTTDAPRWLTRLLTVLAYGIPLSFLAYVLYINYLPFGYEKTFTIDVGAPGDTDSRQAFYLQPSPDLSEPKVAPDGTTYRELNGLAYAVFKPPVVLKDAEITVSVEGEGVSIIPPVIDFNPDDYEWDYAWDFTNKETAFTPKVSERALQDWQRCSTSTEEIAKWLEKGGTIIGNPDDFLARATSTDSTDNTVDEVEAGSAIASPASICVQLPVPDLEGNAFWFDGGMYFNGKSRLEMPGTADMFEDGPFTVYVEWTPNNYEDTFQQIIGHYNWELLQDNDKVQFQIGRMEIPSNPFYSVKYQMEETNIAKKTRTAVITYRPAIKPSDVGYIDLYIDSVLADRYLFGKELISKTYNQKEVLSFGKSAHGVGSFFIGSITKTRFLKDVAITPVLTATWVERTEKGNRLFPTLTSETLNGVTNITLHVHK